MKFQKSLLSVLLVFFFLTGCLGKQGERDTLNGQLNIFGVELFSDVDYRQLNGVPATEEPCLKGYERSFDALDVSIGYGFDKTIRKITTRNASTTLFGIKPGMPYEEGKEKMVQAGFREDVPPFRYKANGYTLKLLVDGNATIFGLTLEARD
jgi:hypothetical protein